MMDNCYTKLNTPFFLIKKEKLDSLTDDMFSSLHEVCPDGIVGYSFKTNNLPWVIAYMKKRGCYAEVVSSDEFSLALKLGYDYDQIIFNGPVKGKKEFVEAIENGSIVNIDAKQELHWLEDCRGVKGKVGIRINFDLESMCPSETQCGADDGRFGFSYETGEFKDALEVLKKNNVKLSGLHLHCSSKTRSLNIYKAIAKTTLKIVNEYRLSPEYIDIGGGFFGGVTGKPGFKDYFTAVREIFEDNQHLKNVQLIVEPGMALIGASVDYLCSVIDTKKTLHNTFLITDGSRIHIDPLMKKTSYTYEVLSGDSSDNIIEKQTLCGFTCMENDRFMTLSNTNELKPGDRVIFKKVGAYTMGLSPLFIQFYPAVYLEDGREIKLVRRKWTAEDFSSVNI